MTCVLAAHECTVDTGMIEDPCPRCELAAARERIAELEAEVERLRNEDERAASTVEHVMQENERLRTALIVVDGNGASTEVFALRGIIADAIRAAEAEAEARGYARGLREAHSELSIRRAQTEQHWTVPYAKGVKNALKSDVPHILATHAVLHASKSVGKLAAVFEAMDHPTRPEEKSFGSGYGPSVPTDSGMETIQAMSADLLTIALRFANLFRFDLTDVFVRRVKEKNGVTHEALANAAEARALAESVGPLPTGLLATAEGEDGK